MNQPSDHRFQSPLIPWNCEVLPNGMSLITKEVHSAPIVAIDIWAATGSGDETILNNGISHFYEHLFFKGTEKYPVGALDKAIKSFGGYDNAETSFDFTHYYVVLPSEHCFTALEILTDAYLNASLPFEEIDRERMVVYEEIRRKEDSPTGKLFSDFLSHLFPGIPYGMEVLGTEESLSRITRDDLLCFKEDRYCPSKTSLVIVGDFQADAIRRKVHDLFEGFTNGSSQCDADFSAKPS
ncbi:MAG TPA: pitrilysin family protein, partial [bacterium]|nr:pitrilysin family protein [bacterium]